MSYWTYINGQIIVSPMGRTDHEKEYILKTVLDHLPVVTGSERDMEIHVVKKDGHNCSCSHDEFGMMTDKGISMYGYRDRKSGWYRYSDEYIVTVNASLRDRFFEETYREFIKWLCRLSKRCLIRNIIVSIDGYSFKGDTPKNEIISNDDAYYEMYEMPSWSYRNGEPESINWCEYLMWDKGYETSIPLSHCAKYYDDDKSYEEFKRRHNFLMGV